MYGRYPSRNFVRHCNNSAPIYCGLGHLRSEVLSNLRHLYLNWFKLLICSFKLFILRRSTCIENKAIVFVLRSTAMKGISFIRHCVSWYVCGFSEKVAGKLGAWLTFANDDSFCNSIRAGKCRSKNCVFWKHSESYVMQKLTNYKIPLRLKAKTLIRK